MAEDKTNYTPAPEENLLGLTDKNLINEEELMGIGNAEYFIFNLDENVKISTSLILELHKISFGKMYDWAGKWRNINVIVGQLTPPEPSKIVNLMYQFIDELNYKISLAKTKEEHVEALAYGHYEFIRIHPFNNGNGRTGRLLMNLIALKFGYRFIDLYYREGEQRTIYINAMKDADKGNFETLKKLIERELTFR
jgi:cell filamentation protein